MLLLSIITTTLLIFVVFLYIFFSSTKIHEESHFKKAQEADHDIHGIIFLKSHLGRKYYAVKSKYKNLEEFYLSKKEFEKYFGKYCKGITLLSNDYQFNDVDICRIARAGIDGQFNYISAHLSICITCFAIIYFLIAGISLKREIIIIYIFFLLLLCVIGVVFALKFFIWNSQKNTAWTDSYITRHSYEFKQYMENKLGISVGENDSIRTYGGAKELIQKHNI